jgi:hypothetical protein
MNYKLFGFVAYLTKLAVNYTTEHQMIESHMKWKGFGRKQLCPNQGTILAFIWTD